MVRAKENVGQRMERSLVLENFRGVDFTSSPLRVDPRRAVKCRNLLPYGGRNVKRRGWRQEHLLREYRIGAGAWIPEPVRGMWWYTYSEGAVEARFLLVHAGEKLYASRDGGNFSIIKGFGMGTEISEAFAFGRRLYLVGHGEYLVFGTWDKGESFELRPVADDEDTYIPRTTIGINPTTNEAGEAIEDTRRGLDAVNLLCSKRINTCMGRNRGEEEESLRFWLDAECADRDDVKIEVETVDGNGNVKTEAWHTKGFDLEELGEANVLDEKGETVGYFNASGYRGGGARSAYLLVYKDCPPPLEGRDNITVTFRHAGVDTAAEASKIGKCRFGVMFGGGGNADRLFLAGNPEHHHVEFYSYWRDPTYFPDNGYNAVGSDSSAIVGYSRISDGMLAVFKEEGRGEPVIYYHTAEDEPVYSKDDETQLEAMKFNLYTDAGNAGEGMISRLASVDFYGDPLFLSRNGVFGLSYKTNVETADRYAAERSRNVRADLLKRDLSKACGAVWENKYWLCVDGVCYVADAGYTCKPAESTSGYQYEWWYLDNLPASVMCVADGCLWFGTEDGRVCRFCSESESAGADAFRDVTWETFVDDATVICDSEDLTRLVVSDEAFRTLRVGDRVHVTSRDFALWLEPDTYTATDGVIVLNDPDRIIHVREGMEVYADTVGASGLSESVAYTVGEIDRGWGTFRLLDGDGEVVELAEGGFRLGLSLTGRELHVIEVIPDEDDGLGGFVRVSLYESGEPFTMMRYGEGGVLKSMTGRLIHPNTVTAEWCTPALDFGTNTQRKTLTRLTVATEPGHSGRVSFGYETREVSRQAAETVGMGGLDLAALDFNEFSLSSFASSWTARVLERNVNYIMFRWASEEAADCRVDSITARYKVTGDIRGGL